MQDVHKITDHVSSQNQFLSLPLEVRFTPTYGAYRLEIGPSQTVFIGGLKARQKAAPAAKYPEWLAHPTAEKDPWMARDELLSKRSGYFGTFTYFFGRFGFDAADLQSHQNSPDVGLQRDFEEWRDLIHAAMGIPMQEWRPLAYKFPSRKVKILRRSIPLKVEWQEGRPVGVVYLHAAIDAIIASIQIDKLNHVDFHYCLRCHNAYQVTSRHKRDYCSPKCGHYMAVRASRERARRNKKKS